MEDNKQPNRGDGLISPDQIQQSKHGAPKKIIIKHDGLMERQENKVLTEDGRELLKEN